MAFHDPTDPDALDERQTERSERTKLLGQAEVEDLKWLMGSKRGRRIVWRLLDQAGVFRLSFNTNAMQMAFAEGNRNFGNRMLAQVNAHCPELFPVMLKEQQVDEPNADDGSAHTKRR